MTDMFCTVAQRVVHLFFDFVSNTDFSLLMTDFQVIEKNSSYHTLENTWTNMLNEADKVATLHTKIKDTLIADPYEKVTIFIGNILRAF